MQQPLLRHSSFIAQLAIALLCILTIPAAQAHSGHHTHEHKTEKASGGDFSLTSATGPVALRDFRGKVVAIYFGYSHCLDVCPIDLGKLGGALKSMKADEVAQIQPIFITVDPERDDAKRLAEYSALFHPKLIGLTGSNAVISTVAKAYGASFMKGPVNAAGAYDLEHPADIFLVGKNGEFLRRLPQSTNATHLATEMRKALPSK